MLTVPAFPIDYVENNLIFAADKSCWAVYELRGYDYDMLSTDEKTLVLHRLTLFIAGIASEAKFMIIPVMQDLETHYDNIARRLDKDDPLYDYSRDYAMLTLDELKKNAKKGDTSANDYKTFVSVKLEKDGDLDFLRQIKDYFDFFIKAVFNDINAPAGLDLKDISADKIREFKKTAAQTLEEQRHRIDIMPADNGTMIWLLRRNMFRGLSEDGRIYSKRYERSWRQFQTEIKLAGEKFIRPRVREAVNLLSGVIENAGRSCLTVSRDGETSYQTFLAITKIPDDIQFPDGEWIYLFQKLPVQSEIYVHIKNTEYFQALRKIGDKRKEANSMIEEIAKVGEDIPRDLMGSKEAIDGIEAELKNNRFPLSDVTVTICVTASNEEELHEKAAYIRREYEEMNFYVERPIADQFDLFMHCLPCVTFAVKDYIMKLPPRAVACGIIGATQQLGDDSGWYIGTTSTDKSVFLDLGLACRTNMSASAVFYGNLGVGKSFNANLLTYLHILAGGYGLIIDPKGERTHWVEKMPVLSDKKLISLVTLSAAKKFRGMLDPFNIFRDFKPLSADEEDGITLATELAKNIITELFLPDSEQTTVLTEVISKIKEEAAPSMSRVIGLLDEYDKKDPLYGAAYMLARRMRPLRETGMAGLFIGDGTEEAIRLDNRLNILQIQNLRLPSPDAQKSDYTDEERVSGVLMMVIAAFTRRFVHSHKNSFKVVLFDESWMLGKTVEGEKLMSYVARMSRSLYSSLILNGHSVTDLPNEGIRNSITYKFCFKTGSTEEAKRMLDFLKLEKTQANIDLIMNLGNAQCLFQDLNGRAGFLRFDAVFGDIIDVFSTTPIDKSELRIAEPAADRREEQKEAPPEIPETSEKELVTVGATVGAASDETVIEFKRRRAKS